jgi:hypothetical protein
MESKCSYLRGRMKCKEKIGKKLKQIQLSSLATILFFITLLLPFLFSYSNLGERCNYSRDCAEGFCFNDTCRIPEILEQYQVTGSCNDTIDCNSGFCFHNECINPLEKTYQTLKFGEGLQSSCAGFIENCIGLWCVFCDVTWIILLISAGAATFITRKSGRLFPTILFIIPILVGILFFPFFGTIVGLLELLLIAFIKPIIQKVRSTGPPASIQPKSLQNQEDKNKQEGTDTQHNKQQLNKQDSKEKIEKLPLD